MRTNVLRTSKEPKSYAHPTPKQMQRRAKLGIEMRNWRTREWDATRKQAYVSIGVIVAGSWITSLRTQVNVQFESRVASSASDFT